MGQHSRGNGGAPGAGEFLAVGGVATAIVLPVLHVAAYLYWRFAVLTVPLTLGYVGWYHTGDILDMFSDVRSLFYYHVWWPYLRTPTFVGSWLLAPIFAAVCVSMVVPRRFRAAAFFAASGAGLLGLLLL